MIFINKLFLVSGHSGGGKTTIMRRLMDDEIVSFTTRDKRPGEVDGKDYIFITKDEYFNLYNANQLIEWTEYSGNYYGITKQELEGKLERNHAFCVVDVHGMEQLKEIHSNCTSIFIYTELEVAKEQMKARGDKEENILKRISTYEEEMQNRLHYDYVIKNTNGKLDEVIEIVKIIIELEVGHDN